MTTLNKDALVAKYIELRDTIQQIEAEASAKTTPLKQSMEKIETYFKALVAIEGVDSWKTKHGTAYISRLDSVRAADPSAFFDFVRETEAWDLIEKRASKTAVRNFLDSNSVLPPGIELTTRVEVNFRRPSN